MFLTSYRDDKDDIISCDCLLEFVDLFPHPGDGVVPPLHLRGLLGSVRLQLPEQGHGSLFLSSDWSGKNFLCCDWLVFSSHLTS